MVSAVTGRRADAVVAKECRIEGGEQGASGGDKVEDRRGPRRGAAAKGKTLAPCSRPALPMTRRGEGAERIRENVPAEEGMMGSIDGLE